MLGEKGVIHQFFPNYVENLWITTVNVRKRNILSYNNMQVLLCLLDVTNLQYQRFTSTRTRLNSSFRKNRDENLFDGSWKHIFMGCGQEHRVASE